MRIQAYVGINVAFVEADEAVSTDWRAYAGAVDLVRVESPPREDRSRLGDHGFLSKPEWITWLAPSAWDEDEFLARLSKKERHSMRSAIRRVAGERVRTELLEPLQAVHLDEFLRLYDAGVGQMRHGWPVARLQREHLLADAEHHFLIHVYNTDGSLAAGCLCQESRHEDAVRLRFSAIEPRWRAMGLARVLRLRMALTARARGFSKVSLGNDPNLYGHVVKPGHFTFKSRLAFVAVPSQSLRTGLGQDVADKVLRLKLLHDPSFMLCYSDDSPGEVDHQLRGVVMSGSTDVDLTPFRGDFLASTEMMLVRP
jgi:GNAT superfamily N-acetyltransferase